MPIPDRLPAQKLPDLNGQRAIVTGASAGIGLATARALARAGAEVVLAVRNPAKGAAVAAQLHTELPTASLQVAHLDLSSLRSIEQFAVSAMPGGVDLLINNAGLSSDNPSAHTRDGFDLQIGVNYLGAFALTCQLWPALRAAHGRVVMLGSLMASRGQIGKEFGQLTGSTVTSYADSKLATVTFAVELRRRCQASGMPVTAVAAHPGWAHTAIFDNDGPPDWLTSAAGLLGWIQSAADGAQPVLLAATAVDPAPYYGPRRPGGLAGPPGPVALPRSARNPDIGPRLWDISQRLTGCELPL